MLQLLNISNVALIDDLRVEFDAGLNLLTGETGSGKSIIVDALGVLLGEKFVSEQLKSGTERGSVEGLFVLTPHPELRRLLKNSGVLPFSDDQAVTEDFNHEPCELIIRRELSLNRRTKTFINNQLATQSLLRDLRPFLVDIHGQGDQQTIFDPGTHLELLDSFAGDAKLRDDVLQKFRHWSGLKRELQQLVFNEAEKFQLVDTLNFQIHELEGAQLIPGEDQRLEDERRRLMNVERLTTLCQSSYGRIYEDDDAALARLRQTANDVAELAEYESGFSDHLEGLQSARAALEELSFALRDFGERLEFSPIRLAQIEDRLSELTRLKRKYGGSIETALEHLARSQDRLQQIELSEERQNEVNAAIRAALATYSDSARQLHATRVKAAKKFEQAVGRGIAAVAMENARFQVHIVSDESETGRRLGPTGIDHVEFFFSANVGEELKPLARVASGGEASRLMLVLKTVGNALEFPRTIVFDEIDTGIGGRVSEAVGAKLKKLAETNQVLCVTHQPQIARFAGSHLVVEKETVRGRTSVRVKKLDQRGRVEELARMLTGAEITESARRHAEELLK